jgi:glycosyltransferase involved in cell wall biosynthesis
MPPKISIIIPTYNSKDTIGNAVKSVICQTFIDWELLIMDGLSNDETLEIVNSFCDERITIFSGKDKGVYDAMNMGISHSRGEWLYFLGGDDEIYDKDTLDLIFKDINDKTDVNVLFGDAFFRNFGYKCYREVDLQWLLLKTNVCHQSVFYRRVVFEKLGGYNLNYKIYADWDLNIRCFMHPGFYSEYVPHIVCRYNDIGGMSAKYIHGILIFQKFCPLFIGKTKTAAFKYSGI